MNLLMFDIDGTLVDSYGFDEECYLKAAEAVLGVKISADWNDYKHGTDAGILDEAIDRYKVSGDKAKIQREFKEEFIRLIKEFIQNNPGYVKEIQGANAFLQCLRLKDNCKLAIATGGWEETAKLKLEAAGIDISGIAFASSSEHHSRIEIMKAAEKKNRCHFPFTSRVYFGDGPWDKKASEDLNYTFVLVGNRLKYKNQIKDFEDIQYLTNLLNV